MISDVGKIWLRLPGWCLLVMLDQQKSRLGLGPKVPRISRVPYSLSPISILTNSEAVACCNFTDIGARDRSLSLRCSRCFRFADYPGIRARIAVLSEVRDILCRHCQKLYKVPKSLHEKLLGRVGVGIWKHEQSCLHRIRYTHR